MEIFKLQRFIDAQNTYASWDTAMEEVKVGKKVSHWIWYVYPQLKGLGMSGMSQFYGISGKAEALAYLSDNLLNERLRYSVNLLLQANAQGLAMRDVFGVLDSKKVNSSLTLFDAVSPNDVFGQALAACYGDKRDVRTLKMLEASPNP